MQTPSLQPGSSARQRAARALWITAAVEVLLFGYCTASAMLVPPPSLAEAGVALPEGMTEEQFATFFRAVFTLMTIGIAMLGLVPAIALAVLGFGVASGKRAAATAARTILMVQAGLAGAVGLLGLVAAVASPVAIVLTLLGAGFVLLALWPIQAIGDAGRSATLTPDEGFYEPWNAHLPT